MNLNKQFILLVGFIVLIGCKEEESKKAEVEQKPVLKEEKVYKLVFEANMYTTKPDKFSLSANDVFLNNSQFMDVKIEQRLNANETEKKLRFEFPENIRPDHQLFFNLGIKEEKDVKFENVSISYGDTKFDINQDNIMEYFTTNKFVEYNSENNTFYIRKVENKLNPLLMVKKKFLDSLQNIN